MADKLKHFLDLAHISRTLMEVEHLQHGEVTRTSKENGEFVKLEFVGL